MRLVGMGWYIGLCIFFGAWGGLWLDSKLNTRPFLVIVGVIAGIIVAVYGVYRMILPAIGNRQDGENS